AAQLQPQREQRGRRMQTAYDFVIVGSGAGGSPLTYRLSEDRDVTVLILEAGGTDLPEAVQVPYRWNELLLTELDWAYMSVPQPGLNGRQIYCAAGKATGGGANLYHMQHVPGPRGGFGDRGTNDGTRV